MSTGTSSQETMAADRAAPAAAGTLDGDPTALGLPGFIAGSVSFGLAQAGMVPAAAAGAALPGPPASTRKPAFWDDQPAEGAQAEAVRVPLADGTLVKLPARPTRPSSRRC